MTRIEVERVLQKTGVQKTEGRGERAKAIGMRLS
jgi:hypothetical protein